MLFKNHNFSMMIAKPNIEPKIMGIITGPPFTRKFHILSSLKFSQTFTIERKFDPEPRYCEGQFFPNIFIEGPNLFFSATTDFYQEIDFKGRRLSLKQH
jgi:hypothetical protein